METLLALVAFTVVLVPVSTVVFASLYAAVAAFIDQRRGQ